MKTRKIFVGLALVCGLAVSSCSKYQTDMPKEREDIILTKTQQAVLDKGNGFAIDFFREMCAENGYENLFISPLSATLALSAVTNGAAGQTMEDMKATLGFGSFSLEDMNVFYKTLIPALKDVDNTVKLQIANAAWIKQGFAVETPFINALTNYYDASVRELDFSSPSAVEAINQWCADNTNNLIKEIINEIDPNARMFYTNALYYKGQWTNKFKKEDN
ncbi:MAG: serpin family protein, partial [Bacteroidales bacterium]|nr:serpin family protein [Bacteroidales bacterium]